MTSLKRAPGRRRNSYTLSLTSQNSSPAHLSQWCLRLHRQASTRFLPPHPTGFVRCTCSSALGSETVVCSWGSLSPTVIEISWRHLSSKYNCGLWLMALIAARLLNKARDKEKPQSDTKWELRLISWPAQVRDQKGLLTTRYVEFTTEQIVLHPSLPCPHPLPHTHTTHERFSRLLLISTFETLHLHKPRTRRIQIL